MPPDSKDRIRGSIGGVAAWGRGSRALWGLPTKSLQLKWSTRPRSIRSYPTWSYLTSSPFREKISLGGEHPYLREERVRVNEFWLVLKGLQGRTVQEVTEVHVGDTDEDLHTRVQVTCTDGYTVQVYVDYEDVDLAVALTQE